MPRNRARARAVRPTSRAQRDSATAFVIKKVTGKNDPADVDTNDRLSVYGYNGPQDLDALAYKINESHWSGVQVSDDEIEKCVTIKDVIKVVSRHMRPPTQLTTTSKRLTKNNKQQTKSNKRQAVSNRKARGKLV
jgi:hypothetical protein